MNRVDVVPPPGPVLQLCRALFAVTWFVLCRLSPRPAHAWRRGILRLFGARVARGAHIYPDCRIWWPGNLRLGQDACLGPRVDCYCVAPIELCAGAIVSQDSYLCTASHDVRKETFDLVAGAITIGPGAWVAARSIILPGVKVGARSVIAAGSVLSKDASAGTIWAGNPAREIGVR
jgi:putative colanic acid biosynthesis acetyltransferase WcaF